MTAALNLNELARISAASLLNCMLEGMGIALFAWVLLRLVGWRNSATRFAVWFFALLAIAALPILGVAASSARLSNVGSAGSAITVPSSWALDIFFVWAAIAGVGLLRVGVGLFHLRKLRRSCSVIDVTSLDPMLQSTLQAFQSVRPLTLRQSDRLRVPTAIGFVKPVVVIPTWALHELSTTELNSILIHELAHLRRRDDWTNLAQQMLKALLFFHPAVWWIQNQLALEREMACDDAVLTETANPRAYAQCLISVAEKSFMRRGLALAQAVVNRMRQTSMRVSRILEVNRSSATRVWKPALYSVAAFFVVCLVSLPHAPELVAFQDPVPDVASAGALPVPALSSAPGAFEGQPVATMASFRESSVGTTDQRLKAAAGARSPRGGARMQAAAQVVSRVGKTAEPLRSERAVSEQESGRLLDARLLQPNPENFVPAILMAIDERSPSPVVFVVMQTSVVVQTSQYEEAGPMVWSIRVWHVTVLDSGRTSSASRIPAKQI
jgi:beta-lactamase regulating signal transducer with metallopeptidase domain